MLSLKSACLGAHAVCWEWSCESWWQGHASLGRVLVAWWFNAQLESRFEHLLFRLIVCGHLEGTEGVLEFENAIIDLSVRKRALCDFQYFQIIHFYKMMMVQNFGLLNIFYCKLLWQMSGDWFGEKHWSIILNLTFLNSCIWYKFYCNILEKSKQKFLDLVYWNNHFFLHILEGAKLMDRVS